MRQRAGGGGGRGDEERLMNDAVHHQNLRYSNFLITISTNVVPKDEGELRALADWLADQAENMFLQWHVLNGTVLKPAGSDNQEGVTFPDPVQIISVRSRFSIEQGDTAQRGQVHMHVLLEVAHTYTNQVEGNAGTGTDDRPVIGVHTNVYQMRERLNAAIHLMDIDPNRRPPKIYVNSRLLTRGTDNSGKWLTLQYINKDVAKPDDYTDGQRRDLRADEAEATAEDRAAAEGLRQQRDQTVIPDGSPPAQRRREDAGEGVGGALTPPPSPPGSPGYRPPGRGIPDQQRFHAPPVAPAVTYTTSTAGIGMPRSTRSRMPGRFRQ